MNESIFDPRRDTDPRDDAIIAELQARLAPLRFDSRPLDLDRLVRDEAAEPDGARIAGTKPRDARRLFLDLAPAARWLIAASFVIVAALSLWTMRGQRPATADKGEISHAVTSSPTTHGVARSEVPTTTNPSNGDEQPQRVAISAPAASPIAPRRTTRAKRADRVTRQQRGRDVAPVDPSAAATEDLLLAIRVTGDKLDRTGRHLAARLAAASFVPDSDFLRSLNPSQTVQEEN